MSAHEPVLRNAKTNADDIRGKWHAIRSICSRKSGEHQDTCLTRYNLTRNPVETLVELCRNADASGALDSYLR